MGSITLRSCSTAVHLSLSLKEWRGNDKTDPIIPQFIGRRIKAIRWYNSAFLPVVSQSDPVEMIINPAQNTPVNNVEYKAVILPLSDFFLQHGIKSGQLVTTPCRVIRST